MKKNYKEVKKVWGKEIWIENRDYCGKRLIVNKGFRCSMHFHKNKHETFYLISGRILMEMGDKKYIMRPGHSIFIKPNTKHRFTGLEDSEIMEFSTHHEDSDSYRDNVSGKIDLDTLELPRVNKLIRIIEQFRNKKILVIGDVMVDKYIWGEVSRISPEAPVQVVNVLKESYLPGGAGNVTNNIASLGAKSFIVGIVGNDSAKDRLISELKARKVDTSGLVCDENRPTTQKVRVFAKNQQLLRFDYEKKGYADIHTQNNLFSFVSDKIEEMDAIIVSDYAKGVVTEDLMRRLIGLCNKKNKMVVVDPKPIHTKFYKNATLITPNYKEAHQMANFVEEDFSYEKIEKLGNKLLKELKSNILITKGEKGMSLFEKGGNIKHIPTFAKEVYDVTGAGDTSVAVLTLALTVGASFEESAIIANHAAGITVSKIGTSAVYIDELEKSLEDA